MEHAAYPFLFEPVYKDYVWGGNRIPRVFGRSPQEGVCAESWEVSDRPEGMSILRNGPLAGKTLHELVTEMGSDLLGGGDDAGNVFPLLIKIIDAKQRLSVQVHPDDRTAAAHGGEAKTEMWYVLDADPGSRVFAGLKEGTDRASFEGALEGNRVEDVLNPVAVTPGVLVFIPGGRVHAIAEGCLLLEVQQNSNTTYRVYDWGRMGNDGKPRELHIEQAFEVIRWEDDAPIVVKPGEPETADGSSCSELIHSPYFRLHRLELGKAMEGTNDGGSFHVLFTVAGSVAIEGNGVVEQVGPGTSCLMPAALSSYVLTPLDGTATVIRIGTV